MPVKRRKWKPCKITKEKNKRLSSKNERVGIVEWRRSKVLELSSQGNSQPEISRALQISYIRQQAQENLKTHIQDKLPEEYQNCMVGINQVLKICWEIVNKSRNVCNENGKGQTITMIDNKTILQSISTYQWLQQIQNGFNNKRCCYYWCYQFVQTNKEKLTSNKKGDKESKEPSYDDDKDQLEKSRKRKLENKKQLIKPMRTDLYSYI